MRSRHGGRLPGTQQEPLILEYVEGETLVSLLARGPFPLQGLAIARQIAEALEAAHEHGVVHRDLKPANLKVTPDGGKVLDFGIAKARTGRRPDAQPAIGRPPPPPGLILGTAPYMSPEQARGKAVDTRADIWAFGCVLYEMLTGGRPFPGRHPPRSWPRCSSATTWTAGCQRGDSSRTPRSARRSCEKAWIGSRTSAMPAPT